MLIPLAFVAGSVIGALAVILITAGKVESLVLARDSFRLELFRAWDDIDRLREHLGLARLVRPHDGAHAREPRR